MRVRFAVLVLVSAAIPILIFWRGLARERALYEAELRHHCERARSSAVSQMHRLTRFIGEEHERTSLLLADAIEDARQGEAWLRRCASTRLPRIPDRPSAEGAAAYLELAIQHTHPDLTKARAEETP